MIAAARHHRNARRSLCSVVHVHEEERMSFVSTKREAQPAAARMDQIPDRIRRSALDRPVVAVLLICLFALVPALVKLAFYPAYPGSDDAFIHMATAEHILDGGGWGIVSNDRVNLSSSPLYTVLLLSVLTVGSIGLAQVLSLVFACAALGTTYLATRAMTSSIACGLAALVVAAANVHLWRWSGTMMETSLGYLLVTVIALTTLMIIRSKSESVWQLGLLGLLIGLGTEVRFEIGLLLPLSFLALWFSRRENRVQLLAVVLGFCIAVVPWIVFSTAYFGTPIPTTFFAKTSGLHVVNVTITKQMGSVVATGFGLSLVLAVAALVIAARSTEGRARLRSQAGPVTYLIAWPIALFAFYYIKTDGLQSAARYYVPGMATWPIAFGLVVGSMPAHGLRKYRLALMSGLVGCLAIALAINVLVIRPVLTAFNDGYRSAMTEGAAYLRANCRPGDVALIVADIGIMAKDGIGACQLMDGGALATPSLRGMTLAEEVAKVHATFVVQTIGLRRDELSAQYPELKLRMSKSYTNHGVSRADATVCGWVRQPQDCNNTQDDYVNIYAVE
jgi:hypothetical protein